MDRALTWFIRIWVGLVILFNLVSIVAIFVLAPSFWDGLSRLWEIFSPYNLKNYFLEMLLFSPAIAAEVWRQKRAQSK